MTRFAVLTVVALTVAASLILAVVQHAYAVSGEQRAIDQARFTAESVLPGRLRPADLRRPLTPRRRRQLDQLFTSRVLADGGSAAAAIYDRNGKLVFAVGPHAAALVERPLVERALTGTVLSRIGPARFGSHRALRTFLPLNVGGSVAGAIVLEQDYGPIAAASRHSSYLIAAVLEGVLVALFVFLIPMLARATRRIGEQVAALDLLASRDELTGLANRVGFRRAYEELQESRPLDAAVIVVDLDGFHELNDTLGPDGGDALLERIAARLDRLDQPAAVARLGEDEFGLLLDSGDGERIAAAAREVGDALAPPLELDGVRVAVGATLGAAVAGKEVDFGTALRRAGVALTAAKDARLPLELYDPDLDDSDVARVSLTAELREALDQGQFRVYYQPQADLVTHSIQGVEALIRWEHPTRGLLEAGAFMPQAERTGLISRIDRFVLGEAAAQWRRWHALGFTLDMAVNVSAVDLLDPHLAASITALISRLGLPARHLTLEITEHTLLRNEEHIRRTLERLTEVGIRLAVDDYGTGYASLRYLRNFPVAQVKLEGSFIAGLPGDGTNEKIVGSTISLAHALGATVVAEGVETIGQWRHLAAAGCDLAQGHLVGPPQPADQLRRELITNPVLPTRLKALRPIAGAAR